MSTAVETAAPIDASPRSVAASSRRRSARRLLVTLSGRGPWRRRGLLALGALVVLLTYDLVVAEVMHDRRQNRLVSEFNAAATSPEIRFGDPIAILQIPEIGLNDVVIEGDSSGNLRAGPGHRLGTALPGSNGNAVISGKSHRYGSPFAELSDLEIGDEIFVARRAAVPIRYVVDEVGEYGSGDLSALMPSSEPRLTLVTSTGWTSRGRLVVRAVAAEPDLVTETPTGVSATPRSDGVSGSDVGVVFAWAAALWVLVMIARRAGSRVPPRTRLVILGPLLGLAVLEVLLNLERVLPSTL
jgi:sortase A